MDLNDKHAERFPVQPVEEDEEEAPKTISCDACGEACTEPTGDAYGSDLAFCCLCANAQNYVQWTPCPACKDRQRRMQ